ncbi:MAG: UDP-N-acetylmuramoyl-tripeptide--D-alanyl-D-alanine ligase [Deltaproteobacteria bacterium]|nr:UDP-N-acetylmuramoyl-tripeptide--D-alanyl-D-alanine ligase [Deltaproteobacteria bacterium]
MNDTKPIPWNTSDILAATGGELLSGTGDRVFGSISIDSRAIGRDAIFVAIAGETHDGHTFVENVLKDGIKGVLVEKAKVGATLFRTSDFGDSTIIGVADTIRALGDLAAYNRNRVQVPIIALTGSNGKTSTRTMLTHITGLKYMTLSTAGNFNNEIGLPLTLLRLQRNHNLAVLELGMNRPGEIARLAEICRPDIGMITNVAPAHLEGLRSVEGVLRAKGELLEKLNRGGTTVLNADDRNVLALAEDAPGDVLLFGTSQSAAVRASRIRNMGDSVSFLLEVPADAIEVVLETPGLFMVSNALAAAAAAYLMRIPLHDIKKGLERFKPVNGRLHIRKLANGARIIDDTYNANPGSVKAALDTLKQTGQDDRRVAVLGDMLELGSASAGLHREVGYHAATAGLQRLYLTGEFARDTAQGAIDGGMAAGKIVAGSLSIITEQLIARTGPRHCVLIKGSRGMRMEQIVKKLIDTFG